MKRWTPTLIVVGAFVALLAYILLVEVKKEPPASEDATPTPVPLLNLNTDEVRSILVTDGQRRLRLVREGQDWRIVEPEESPADGYRVFLQADELAHLEARLVVLEQVSDLGTYGLDPVAWTLMVDTASSHHEIHVGRETPDKASFYVQIVGDPRLYIVPHYKLAPFLEWLSDPPYKPTPTPQK